MDWGCRGVMDVAADVEECAAEEGEEEEVVVVEH